MQISTIGLDLAKNVFQVHGVDAAGKTVITKQLRRGQVLMFSQNCRRASSARRRARPGIIGRANSPSLGIPRG